MKYNFILIGFLLLTIMSSCIVYQTQMTDIPLISEKNDLRIDGGISLIPAIYSTVSYGLTDNVTVQGFGNIGTDDKYYFQAASGLYKNIGNNQVLELYGGLGYGYGNAYNDAHPGNLQGNYQLYFGQFNYGKIASESSNFEIGLGIKTGYLHSNLTDINYYDKISMTGPFNKYIDESILCEPIGFMRFGGDRLKFSFKLGSTLIYKFTNTDRRLPYSQLNIGIGLNYRL